MLVWIWEKANACDEYSHILNKYLKYYILIKNYSWKIPNGDKGYVANIESPASLQGVDRRLCWVRPLSLTHGHHPHCISHAGFCHFPWSWSKNSNFVG